MKKKELENYSQVIGSHFAKQLNKMVYEPLVFKPEESNTPHRRIPIIKRIKSWLCLKVLDLAGWIDYGTYLDKMYQDDDVPR